MRYPYWHSIFNKTYHVSVVQLKTLKVQVVYAEILKFPVNSTKPNFYYFQMSSPFFLILIVIFGSIVMYFLFVNLLFRIESFLFGRLLFLSSTLHYFTNF